MIRKRFLFDVDAEQIIVRQDRKKGLIHLSVGTGFASGTSENMRELAEALNTMADNLDFDDVDTGDIEDEAVEDFREEEYDELEDFPFDDEV